MNKTDFFKKGDVLIPKGSTYPTAAITVVSSEDGVLKAFPEGGGMVLRFDAAGQAKFEFRKVTAEEMRPGLRAGLFSMEGGKTYAGWTDGRRWNGWASPKFDQTVFKQALADLGGRWEEETQQGVLDGPAWKNHHERIEGEFNEQLKTTLFQFSGFCWDEEA